jgi:hypothetical protein
MFEAQAAEGGKRILGTLTYEPSTRELSHVIVMSGMNEEDRQVRIHQGAEGENGPMIHLLDRLVGTITLAEVERQALMEDRLYMAIYTASRPEAVLRGQVRRE